MVTIMAHFAEIDKNGIVLRVVLVDNEHENRGQEYLAKDLNLGGTWIQTSYNHKFRGKFAGINDIYDKENDIFIADPNQPKSLLVDETISK
jgi:hypothetical protein